MRVESAKNNQADKKEVSNFKPEKPLFDSTSSTKTANIAALPTQGAFEKILTETRQQSSREKEKPVRSDATAANESAAETAESDEEKEVNRRAEQKTESKEKNKDGGKGGEQANDEENSPAFTASVPTNESKSAAPAAAPAARQILHVADLERIVSFIRTQNSGDARQILISLKHTVLEGLQIRLTLNQNGNLKAEFLALNEQVKKQLKQRERELLGILKQRSARFTEIDILMI